MLGEVSLTDVTFREPSLVLGYYDAQAAEFLQRRCLQGRMPAKPGEIAIERSALNRLRLEAELGETIELELRVPKGNGEFLDKTVKKRYMLVGILNEQSGNMRNSEGYSDYSYISYPSALVSNQEMVEPGGRAAVTSPVKPQTGDKLRSAGKIFLGS